MVKIYLLQVCDAWPLWRQSDARQLSFQSNCIAMIVALWLVPNDTAWRQTHTWTTCPKVNLFDSGVKPATFKSPYVQCITTPWLRVAVLKAHDIAWPSLLSINNSLYSVEELVHLGRERRVFVAKLDGLADGKDRYEGDGEGEHEPTDTVRPRRVDVVTQRHRRHVHHREHEQKLHAPQHDAVCPEWCRLVVEINCHFWTTSATKIISFWAEFGPYPNSPSRAIPGFRQTGNGTGPKEAVYLYCWCLAQWWHRSPDEWSCATSSLVSTGMGNHFCADVAPRYATKPTRSTELASLNPLPVLVGWGDVRNVTSVGWQVTLSSDVVLEARVLVSRRLETQMLKTWSWSWSWRSKSCS